MFAIAAGVVLLLRGFFVIEDTLEGVDWLYVGLGLGFLHFGLDRYLPSPWKQRN